MKKGIAVAGNLIVDLVKTIDCFPREGMLANILSESRCIGGCAGNTLCDLARIDSTLPLYCFGKIGNDDNGRFVLDILREHNIILKNIVTSNSHTTSYTDVMLNLSNDERTFFHKRGANSNFNIDDIKFEDLDCDIFHMGYALLLDEFDKEDDEYGTIMAKTLASVQKKGIKTSMDVVSEDSDRYKKVVSHSLKYCDYLIINEIEASNISGIDIRDSQGEISLSNLENVCKNLLKSGVKDMVVIHMPEMGCAMNSSHEFYLEKSYKLPQDFIKGTVGAGDAFCAGMLYGIYSGCKIPEALLFANCCAASCLTSENSIDGMKTKNEIIKLQKKLSQR